MSLIHNYIIKEYYLYIFYTILIVKALSSRKRYLLFSTSNVYNSYLMTLFLAKDSLKNLSLK